MIAKLLLLFSLLVATYYFGKINSTVQTCQEALEDDIAVVIKELKELDSECRVRINTNPFKYSAPYKVLPWKRDLQEKLAKLFSTRIVDLHKKVKEPNYCADLSTDGLDDQFSLIMEAYHSIKKRSR